MTIRPTVARELERSKRLGDNAPLDDMLDCDYYTRHDHRALEGLGWQPLELNEDERGAILDQINEVP